MVTITKRRATLHTDNGGDSIDTQADQGSIQMFNPPGDDLEPEQTDVDRVSAMLQLASGAGRASVKVYKVENGKAVFCDSFQPSEFEDGDFRMIRDAFGAGIFRIMLYGAHPVTGNFGILSRTEVTIAENRAPKTQQTGAQSSELAQMLQSLAQGQQAMLDALIAVKQQPPVDPMAQMTQMLSMMTMMREAMGLNVQPQKSSSISEVMAAVREMREVASEIVPKGESEDSLSGMLPQVLGIIQQGMQSQAQPQPQPAMLPQIQLPQSITQAQPVDAPQPGQGENVNLVDLMRMRGYLTSLVTMAKDGQSPQAGAELIYEKLPDDFVELMALDNWFDALMLFDKDVGPHRGWLQQARDIALALFDAPDDETPGASQATGTTFNGDTGAGHLKP